MVQRVEVRPAGPDDAAVLAVIDELVSPAPWSVTQYGAACDPRADSTECALVLTDVGQVLGFVVFSRVLDEASIHNIAVHPCHQGKGFGRALLESALAQVRGEGANSCYLEVRASNLAARAMYEKLSFQVSGVRRNYYSSAEGREDAVLMSKQL